MYVIIWPFEKREFCLRLINSKLTWLTRDPLLVLGSSELQADLIVLSASGEPYTQISPTNDSIQLGSAGPNSDSVVQNVPTTVFLQNVGLLVGNTPGSGLFPFTLTESVTLNGDTKSITITGNVFVNSTGHFIFDAGQVYNFRGGYTFQQLATTSPSYGIGAYSIALQAEVTSTGQPAAVPEPSSCVLLALGGIGSANGAYRRKRAAPVV